MLMNASEKITFVFLKAIDSMYLNTIICFVDTEYNGCTTRRVAAWVVRVFGPQRL